jgi:hypothetical protein
VGEIIFLHVVFKNGKFSSERINMPHNLLNNLVLALKFQVQISQTFCYFCQESQSANPSYDVPVFPSCESVSVLTVSFINCKISLLIVEKLNRSLNCTEPTNF